MKKLVITSMLIAGSLLAENSSSFEIKRDVVAATDSLYLKECGSCHFAYQPGLLPSKSWVKVMENLSNHFGTDASVESAENSKILKYLKDNSAEKFTNYKRSKKINDSIGKNETPVAITKTGYFIKEHKGIKPKLIEQKEVKSLSNCMACHTKADKGSYSEREINIPNYGKWKNE